MSFTHCSRCSGLVLAEDRACRICRRPIERTDRVAPPNVMSAPLSAMLAQPAPVNSPGSLHFAGSKSGSLPESMVTRAPTTTSAPGEIDLRTPGRPDARPVPRPETRPDARVCAVAPGTTGRAPGRVRSVGPAAPPSARPHFLGSASRPQTAVASALSVRNLTKTFGQGDLAVAAVTCVNFEVLEGEVVLIMGPSGSGKTTLLLMLGAMLRPTTGSVVIGGTDVTAAPERRLPKLRASHLGFVFQDFNLLAALNATENVELACNLAGVKGRVAAERSTHLLQRVGLGHRLTFRPNQLSGGEKQRVAVARALANDPPLLLADEPTANLDSGHGREVGQLLRRLSDEDGRTSLIVTHDERLLDIADRVMWLEDGALHQKEHR